jgi:Flp pilus assembly CpaE family ATPase
MAVFLLTPDVSNGDVSAIESKLRALVPAVRKISKMEEIGAEIRGNPRERSYVIVVLPIMPASGIDNLITIAQRFNGAVYFILVSNEISASDYKRLVRSGAADWVAAGGSLQEVPEILNNQSALPNQGIYEPPIAKPTILSFLPCLGGVGNTTVALECALHATRAKVSRSWKICYVDLDFQTSHVCDYLDVEARLQIEEIFDRPERLDEQLFDRFTSHHSSGLDVFAAPRSRLDPCQTNITALDMLLELMLQKYDFVLLDLPELWFRWTYATIKNSNAILVTGINTVPCLRQMKTTLGEVIATKSSTSQVAIVINRITHGMFGRIERRGHVESVLSGETIFYIQEDSYAIDRVNAGTPAMLGASSKFNDDINKLATFCENVRRKAAARS